MQLDSRQIGWLLIAFFLGVTMGAAGVALAGQSRPAPIVIEPPPPPATPAPTATPGPLRVFVNGEVMKPAVYALPAGSIVEDAIALAGGFTDAAEGDLVNLAQPLVEGMQIQVPAAGQTPAGPVISGGPVVSTAGGAEPVNINTATVEELDALPGIGPSTAQKIIDYRRENGGFIDKADIMNVPGIGESKFEQIKDLIIVE